MATVDTSISTPSLAAVPLFTEASSRVKFSRDAYYQMYEIGVLRRDKRYELLEGDVYMMSPIGPNQSNVTSRLMDFFVACIPREFQCRIQQPIVLGDQSEPEPDVAIVRRRDMEYSKQHPGSTEVLLLVEVAQSSLSFDLGAKLKLYAHWGIAEYWVIDLVNRKAIVHRDPAPTGFRDVSTFSTDATITPVCAPACRLDIGWLLR